MDDLPPGVEIAHASEVVEMCDNPATAFKEKKDSSLTVGLNLLKNGAARRVCFRRQHRGHPVGSHPAG